MAIFLTIFAMAASFTFLWSQQFADYGSAAKKQLELQQERAAENLVVEVLVSSEGGEEKLYLELLNPTDRVIIVNQIWSNHQNLLEGKGEIGIPPFSAVRVPSDDMPVDIVGDKFTVVTKLGRTFTAYRQQSERRWVVTWYEGNNPMGMTYWDNLNLNLRWMATGKTLKFEAVTKVTAFGSTAYIIARITGTSITVRLDDGNQKIIDQSTPYATLELNKIDPFYEHKLELSLTPTENDVEVVLTFINLDFAH